MSVASILPLEEIVDVVHAPNAGDLFIGARLEVAADRLGRLILLRGDLTLLIVPVLYFKAVCGLSESDLAALEIIDHGQTLRFGGYEIAADALLYELDSDFRRRCDERRAERAP